MLYASSLSEDDREREAAVQNLLRRDDDASSAPSPPPSYASPGHVRDKQDGDALLTSLRGATTSDELSVALDALRHAIEHRDATIAKIDVLSTAQTWRKANQALWTPGVGLKYGAVVRAFGASDVVERREDLGGHEEGAGAGAGADAGTGGGGQGGDDWLSEVIGEEKRASRDPSTPWREATALAHSRGREEGKSEGAESVEGGGTWHNPQVRTELFELYQRFNPSKATPEHVDDIMETYDGRDAGFTYNDLFRQLYEKYGLHDRPPPPYSHVRPTAAADGPDGPPQPAPPKNALLLLCGWRDEGDPHVVAEALIEAGIDIEEKDESGRTALIIAAYVEERRREGEKERRREGEKERRRERERRKRDR